MITEERKRELVANLNGDLSPEEIHWLLHGDPKPCKRCNDTGWLEPIGPKPDGSYITSRPCSCGGPR